MIIDLLTILFIIGGLALLWSNSRSDRDVVVTPDQREPEDCDPPRSKRRPF